MSTKDIKAVADVVEPSGEVTAMVSPFGGKPDLQGDVVDDHAYDASIAFWNSADRKLPVIDTHNWSNVDADLGYVKRLEAVPGYGLVAHMQLDLTNPRAKYVHKLLSERRRVEFSIGYDALDEEKQKDGSNLLKRINLHEVSLVLRGAAADAGAPVGRTELLGVKTSSTSNSTTSVTFTNGKAPEDVERLRQHLRTGHGRVPGEVVGHELTDLVFLHIAVHGSIPASAAHIRTGDPSKAGPNANVLERIEALTGKARAPKSESELRAEVNQLYDTHVLKPKMAEYEADAIMFDVREQARERRRKQLERARFMKRTEAPR